MGTGMNLPPHIGYEWSCLTEAEKDEVRAWFVLGAPCACDGCVEAEDEGIRSPHG
jgi:hypothetical protein